ncbi:hypothetical protein [Negadavirga shengliensis]|uniref:Phage abortive infection protein n=1 Tax=Negadavirga shengliensis TaxID=1389218 RepID=A0ABV9T764_9BACT
MKDLNKSFIKKSAIVLACCVPCLILLPLAHNLAHYFFEGEAKYSLVEYGAFVGGVAGPIAALAGFLFVYLSFEGQQQQFHQTKTDEMFFKLFDSYLKARNDTKFKNKIAGKDIFGDYAFKYILESMRKWVKERWIKDYKTEELQQKFKNDSGYDWIEKPPDFKESEMTRFDLEKFLKINDNEEYYGIYNRSFELLINYCFENKLESYLTLIESSMGKYERIYQYYNCSSRIDPPIETFLESNRFLRSVSKKHLEQYAFGVLFWYKEELGEE